MSLQFITGASGAGKSTYIYRQIIARSEKEPEGRFFYPCAGSVYDADAEGSGQSARPERDYEYRRSEFRTSDAPYL